MDWVGGIESVGIVGALLVSAYQTWRMANEERKRDADRRTERSLELYRDLVVEGDTAAAFHRLSVRLRDEGSSEYGTTTWLCPRDSDFDPGKVLDPAAPGIASPFEDLYRVLWFFERVDRSLEHGLVDRHVLFSTIGFHCWWWASILWHIEEPKAKASLAGLGRMTRDWAEDEGVLPDWERRCEFDFNGAGPRLGGRKAGGRESRSSEGMS